MMHQFGRPAAVSADDHGLPAGKGLDGDETIVLGLRGKHDGPARRQALHQLRRVDPAQKTNPVVYAQFARKRAEHLRVLAVSGNGAPQVPARRFNLSGDARLDLWYDRSNSWAATRFNPEDGSEVLFERI